MAYTKTVWVDRAVQFFNRFTKANESPTSVDLTQAPGTVTQAGTPVNAANLNKIENALESMIGKDNTTIVETTSIKLDTDTRSAILTYTSGQLTKVEEKDGATVIKTTNLTYDGSGVLTKVDEIAGGRTVTTNLVYTTGVLTSTTKAVV